MDYLSQKQNLPQEVQDFISSNEPRIRMERACFSYGVDPKKIQGIAKEIGLMMVKLLPLSDLPKIIEKAFSPIQPATVFGISYEMTKSIFLSFPSVYGDAQKLSDEWKIKKTPPTVSGAEVERILTANDPAYSASLQESEKQTEQIQEKQQTPKKTFSSVSAHITLTDILAKYPRVWGQAITEKDIALKGSADPVRPTVKNWITNYQQEVGPPPHEPFERGQYLFHNKNVTALSDEERDRVALLLKSLDERIPLSVSARDQRILFDEATKNSPPPSPAPRDTRRIDQSAQRIFSSKKPAAAQPIEHSDKIVFFDDGAREKTAYTGQERIRPSVATDTKTSSPEQRMPWDKATITEHSYPIARPARIASPKSSGSVPKNIHFSSPQTMEGETREKRANPKYTIQISK